MVCQIKYEGDVRAVLININRIKELKEKRVVIVDLSEYLGENFDIVLPFKVRGLDEQIKLLSSVKYGKSYKGVKKYTPYRDCPAEFKKFYEESNALKGSHEMLEIERSKAFVIIDPEKDITSIKEMSLLQRLMNVVIHIDMDYEVELTDGEETKVGTMWEAWGVKKGDYMALAKTFADIITNDAIVKVLEFIVEGVKSNAKDLKVYVGQASYTDMFKNLTQEEKDIEVARIMKQRDEIDAELAKREVEENEQ